MLWDFFSQVYRLPMMLFKRALANPMGIFVYGILSKWYTLVVISTVIVTFWVFKGLQKAGVLDAIDAQLKTGFYQAQSVAQNCTPLIMNLEDMWACVQNPPEFVSSADDEALTKGMMSDAEENVQKGQEYGNKPDRRTRNPYEDEDEEHNTHQNTTSGSSADAVGTN